MILSLRCMPPSSCEQKTSFISTYLFFWLLQTVCFLWHVHSHSVTTQTAYSGLYSTHKIVFSDFHFYCINATWIIVDFKFPKIIKKQQQSFSDWSIFFIRVLYHIMWFLSGFRKVKLYRNLWLAVRRKHGSNRIRRFSSLVNNIPQKRAVYVGKR